VSDGQYVRMVRWRPVTPLLLRETIGFESLAAHHLLERERDL
jgi:hypothetical protein